MILRLLRQLFRTLARLHKTAWNDRAKLFRRVAHGWIIALKLLKSRFTLMGCSGSVGYLSIMGWSGAPKGGFQDSPAQSPKPDANDSQNRHPEPGKIAGAYTGSISCSLHPHYHRDGVALRPEPSAALGSPDAQSIDSTRDAISFTLESPHSPASALSGEERIHVVEPVDSPQHSTGSLDTETDELHDSLPDHLEAPRRPSRPTSLSSRPRSTSPGGRSSLILRPASSNASFGPHGPSPLRLSRPPSPLSANRSLRPNPSRTSLRSYSSARQTRPPSIIEQEPPPLPIIEPLILSEHFDDPEGNVWALAPEMVDRYDRKIFAQRNGKDTVLEPLTMRFEPPWNPKGWEPIIHPEGQLYFWHSEKRIVTEAYLYNRDIFHHLHRHLAKIESFVERTGLQNMLRPYDLVLDLIPREEGGYFCGYYFVNHQERSIFWLQRYDAARLSAWDPAEGHKSKLHLKHEIEAQYWYHCQLFPTTLILDLKLVSELRDIILHNITDTMTSFGSTAPYSHEDLNRMLGWVNSLKKNLDISYSGSGCLVGRLMYIFTHERFLHFYGEPAVRLRRGLSVYGTIHRRTLLIRFLSPLLFAAPLQHLTALEKIWVDGVLHEPTWKLFINKFNKQWEEFILFATVMLNANVAFLAIQSVDTPTNDDFSMRKPEQIASYLSVFASIGSIIIGLLLIKMNRIRLQDTAPDALRFLSERSSKALGLEILAILYGLPFALLMWGMIAFLVAFCCMCFEGTTKTTQGVVGSAFVLAGFLVVWCIWVGWDKHIHLQPEEPKATIVFTEDESEENAARAGDTDTTVVSTQQNQTAPQDPGGGGSTAGSNRAAERSGVFHQLSVKWKGLWSGRLNLGMRSNRTGAPITPEDSNATTIV